MLEPEQSPGNNATDAAQTPQSEPSRVIEPLPRLLVIDDDYLHRKIICRVAARSGYAPAGAATYDEGAKLALENAFDCISLDLSLGPHDGLEMLHYLSSIGCKAPIIVISGCDEATVQDTRRAAKSLNLDIRETVAKPVDLDMLRYCFERIRAQHHTPAAA